MLPANQLACKPASQGEPLPWKDSSLRSGRLKENAVPAIREVATLTSKGQITLPKAVREALGVDYGGKLAFEVHGSEVVVSRAEESEHADPAIGHFLGLLEADIRSGKHLTTLPESLVQAMVSTLSQPVDLDHESEGDVAL
jgi:antitoxin PrlF